MEGAQFRYGDLVVCKQFQQETLKLLVGAVKLVDQQHRGAISGLVDGLQQGTLDEELRAEEVNVGINPFIRAAPRLHEPDLQQLPRVVPLVHRVVHVQSLIALQADEVGVESGGQRAGDFGFADAGLAFQKQRALQFQSQEDGNGQSPVGYVRLVPEQILDIFYRAGNRSNSVSLNSSQKKIPVVRIVRGHCNPIIRIRTF